MNLSNFSKVVCFFTLLLIFVGGMVTSTGSGLSVPDWPLSYGMVFPPMVGGVFYEHGHRMVASFVGFLTIILSIWLARTEKRKWVTTLGFCALGTVVLQGLLGGLTVKMYLPPAVSVCHAVLAQTFFVLTIVIAYSQSHERKGRESETFQGNKSFIILNIGFAIIIYFQLILGAIMRHTHSGLAIPDFPTMGGYYIPPFNETMLAKINAWHFENNLDYVTMTQVIIHFIHRLGGLVILIVCLLLGFLGLRYNSNNLMVKQTLIAMFLLVLTQISLGILTVISQKSPIITSIHVMAGAATLGVSVLLCLRSAPVSWNIYKNLR